jgi:hypothetical protein
MIRNAYLKKAEEALHKLDKEIDSLGKKVETASAGAKEDLSRQIDALRGKSEVARERIRGVREAGAETWGRLKRQTEDAVDDVRKDLETAIQKLRKTG